MATTYILFIITLVAFYYFCRLIIKRSSKIEKFQDTPSIESKQTTTSDTSKKEEPKEKKGKENGKEVKPIEDKTPAESGLVFGYLPTSIPSNKPEYKIDPNAIYSGSAINISSKNLYLGMSDKNPLLPVFLETLGTFKPYEYQNVKIHIKDNDFNATSVIEEIVIDGTKPKPIFYNKTIVCFTIKYLQENYFLQYVGNTSTFYLTKTPSYFNLLYAMDVNTEREAKYDDSILIKCLDTSELLLIYDSFIITESNKSSTFTIKRSEGIDLCLNFNKSDVDLKKFTNEYIDPEESARRYNIAKTEIDRFLSQLKNKQSSNINSIKANIVLLEQKRNNLITKSQLGIEQKKAEYKKNIDEEKAKIDKEIKSYKEQLDKQYEIFKFKLTQTKSEQWEKELTKFRNEITQKCKK